MSFPCGYGLRGTVTRRSRSVAVSIPGIVELLAQFPLEHLAVVVRRQGIDESVVLRALVAGDGVQTGPVEVFDRRWRCALGGYHEGDHGLAPFRVGPPDHGHRPHVVAAQ